MLERLKEYLEKFEQEKKDIEQANDEDLVAEMVRAYEAEVRTKLEKSRADSIAEREAEIKVVEKLIELETAKQEATKKEQEKTVAVGEFQIADSIFAEPESSDNPENLEVTADDSI